MNELDFMPLIFKNFYSDPSTVGFRYCKDGIISAEYKEDQIRIQDMRRPLNVLKRVTLSSCTLSSGLSTQNLGDKVNINIRGASYAITFYNF
jgi:hypothetical protein